MGSTPVAGNVLVLNLEHNDTAPTVSSTNVTWTRQSLFLGDGTHNNTAFFTGLVGASAGTVITIAWNTTGAAVWGAICVELDSVNQVIENVIPTATNVASTTPSISTVTPATGNTQTLAFCGHVGTTAPTATPAGWTTLTRVATNVGLEGVWINAPGMAPSAQWTFAGSTNALLNIVSIQNNSFKSTYQRSENMLTNRRT